MILQDQEKREHPSDVAHTGGIYITLCADDVPIYETGGDLATLLRP